MVDLDNIIMNGNENTFQVAGSETGIDLSLRTNITAKNSK
jgi:hypothetical protein